MQHNVASEPSYDWQVTPAPDWNAPILQILKICQHTTERFNPTSLRGGGHFWVRLWFKPYTLHAKGLNSCPRRLILQLRGSFSDSDYRSCRTKKGFSPPKYPHHIITLDVWGYVCLCVRARARVFKWDNGVNLKTMLCACQAFEAEPSTIVPRGIYPESLPTTLLNSTSVRFYNTIVRLNRFLFGCVTAHLLPPPPAPSPWLVVLVCLRCPILSPGSV